MIVNHGAWRAEWRATPRFVVEHDPARDIRALPSPRCKRIQAWTRHAHRYHHQ